MLTLIKMKWIVMLLLLLYTAGSYLHCAVLYGDILAQKYTIVLDFKDTPVEAVLDAITKQTGIKIAYNTRPEETGDRQDRDIRYFGSVVCRIGRQLYLSAD